MSAWLHIFQWSMRNPVFRSVGIIFTLHLCVECLVFFLNQKGNIARLDLMLFWGVSGPVALEEFSGPSFGPIESLTGPPPRYTSCSASVTAWIIKMIRHTPLKISKFSALYFILFLGSSTYLGWEEWDRQICCKRWTCGFEPTRLLSVGINLMLMWSKCFNLSTRGWLKCPLKW